MRKRLLLFLAALISLLAFSSIIAIGMMDLAMFLLVFGVSSFYLLVVAFTWSNLSSWRKQRGQKGEEIIRTELSPDETFDLLSEFFSKTHGFTKMRILETSKPSWILVRLNSWIGMGRGFNRPPGTMEVNITADSVGCKIRLKFDFLAIVVVMYLIAVGVLIFGSVEFFNVIVKHGSVYSLLAALFVVVLPIPAFQIPFTVTMEQRAYFRTKILQSLREFHKRQQMMQTGLSPET